ncbi:MAG: peroxidase [Gammaproteobacteria bacterium]
MARFASLPEQPQLADVFKRFSEGVWPLMAFHDAILRGESEFTAAERELIAAYTSVLNACDFCHGSHQIIAGFHGIEPAVFANLVSDLTQAGLEENWLPLLAYVDKLTESPARLAGGDAQAVFAAGWSEDALYDAIVVCATFNLMNRIVEGCGVVPAAEGHAASRERHQAVKSSDLPYTYSGRLFGIDPD